MIDTDLLDAAMKLTQPQQKEAYAPPGAPPMDPAAMGGAPPGMPPGMPPMDPAAMMGGGAPPMDPAAMMGGAPPMDPSMMGGAPPMDPSMMGGMPPMDPAAMGGAPPPMDPSMVGGLGGEEMPPEAGADGMPVMLNIEDLKAIMSEASGGDGGPEEESARVTNRDLGDRMDGIEAMMGAIMTNMGISMPPELAAPPEAVAEEAPIPEGLPEAPPAPPEAAMAGGGQDIGALLGAGPTGLEMPKQASFSDILNGPVESPRESDAELLNMLKRMNSYT